MSTGSREVSPVAESDSANADAERRTAPRRPCDDGSVKVVVLLGPEPCTATVRDISAGGIGILVDAILAPGDRLNIEFRNPARGVCYCKTVEVIHSSLAEGGRWLVGGAFSQALTLEEFRQLLPPQ